MLSTIRKSRIYGLAAAALVAVGCEQQDPGARYGSSDG